MTLKKSRIIAAAVAAVGLVAFATGCYSTVTHYDENGRVIKVEEATNFSRVMDGTNAKSQLMLVNGFYAGFEASATAGENCTPGVITKFANGKIAVVNIKDKANFTGADAVIKTFFAGGVEVGPSGVKTQENSATNAEKPVEQENK